jgi:hypothetical protein
MKKMMGLVLGLSLAVGAFSFAFAQDGGKDSTKATGGKKGKGSGKKGKDSTK